MGVIIIRNTEAAELEKKINQQLENMDKGGIYENVKVQYQTATVPQMRGDKVTGYKVEYSALISFNVMQPYREA